MVEVNTLFQQKYMYSQDQTYGQNRLNAIAKNTERQVLWSCLSGIQYPALGPAPWSQAGTGPG